MTTEINFDLFEQSGIALLGGGEFVGGFESCFKLGGITAKALRLASASSALAAPCRHDGLHPVARVHLGALRTVYAW